MQESENLIRDRTRMREQKLRQSSPPPLRNYGKSRPWQAIFLSFFLVLAGFQMFYFSFTAEHLPDYELVICFLFGVLLLIPGLYHTFIIINIWLGTKGYDYHILEYNQS